MLSLQIRLSLDKREDHGDRPYLLILAACFGLRAPVDHSRGGFGNDRRRASHISSNCFFPGLLCAKIIFLQCGMMSNSLSKPC
jgi:hypothetical protein